MSTRKLKIMYVTHIRGLSYFFSGWHYSKESSELVSRPRGSLKHLQDPKTLWQVCCAMARTRKAFPPLLSPPSHRPPLDETRSKDAYRRREGGKKPYLAHKQRQIRVPEPRDVRLALNHGQGLVYTLAWTFSFLS